MISNYHMPKSPKINKTPFVLSEGVLFTVWFSELFIIMLCSFYGAIYETSQSVATQWIRWLKWFCSDIVG